MADTIDPAVVGQIATIIRQAVAEDWIQDFDINGGTRFNDDLELESIEFVAIAANLQEHFGAHVDLVGWLSAQSFDELVSLRVGDIAQFVTQAQPRTGSKP